MDNVGAENQAAAMNVLGIDIGGSAVKGAPVDVKTGRMLAERYRVETPEPITPRRMAQVVVEIARHFKWRGPIGVGFPGVVLDGKVKTAANLHPGFVDCDLARLIGKATGSRVRVINDADAAGLAEMRFGAGKGKKGTVILFTLGTGIGSALFNEGVLLLNTELGHLPYKGRAFEKFAASSVRKAQGLSWQEWGARLNLYLAVIETIFWPDLIVLGGGASAKHEKFFQYLQTRAPVLPAKLFNAAGIVGAALHGG
jgi:polyphosphate glucokinase